MSRAARFWSSWTISAVVLLALLAGCGGTWRPTFQPHGFGKDQYWIAHAKGRAKAVVVFLHGLGPNSGEQLEPWQAHLAEQGYDVIYPRYEDPPPAPDARNNIVGAVGRALGDLGRPQVPLVLLGHSRGGRLAVEAAAFLKPKLVLAFYPGQINPTFEPPTNFALIPPTTNVWLFVGDKDRSVGNQGALELDKRLLTFGFPARRIHGAVIRSKGFTADHMSVYDLSPAAKRGIWERADRLIERASS
ncbi:MAG: alpha/beta fold hydrolase [Thermoleophilia bacterium]|nr:alpha/beta fold hydrolase [Thermoleophilia bacterium]